MNRECKNIKEGTAQSAQSNFGKLTLKEGHIRWIFTETQENQI